MKYEIVSADAHVLEPPHIWDRWLGKKYQDKAPKLVKDSDGGDAWQFPGSPDPDPIGLVTTPGLPWDQFRWTGVTYEQARAGCYDGAERLKDMDVDGVDAEVLFAPQRTIGAFLGDEDDEFVLAGVDAYNNFLREEFCAPDPSRLIGAAWMPSTGIEDAVRYLYKAKEQGFKAVAISNWPSGGDSLTEADDPFWAALSEVELPLCIHILIISRRTRQAQRAAAMAAAAKGASALYGGTASKANAKAVAGLGSVFSTVPGTIGQLIFTGVFERFPKIHICIVESGVGWIPHFLEQIDDRYWRNRSWGNIPISEPPSYFWYRNMSATFITDPTGIKTRHSIGVDNMMWSTDYPHHGNDWPYSRKTINDMMVGVPAEERERIVAGNARRIYRLEDSPLLIKASHARNGATGAVDLPAATTPLPAASR
jgi:predicted TIM-barrel fold metal-dependent hydrolase